MHAGRYNGLINLRNRVQGVQILTGHDFGDISKTVHLVAGIDSLGRIADRKLFSADKA